MEQFVFDAARGGYHLRYFFNAGLNRETLICDEEGTEFYDEVSEEYIGQVDGYLPSDLMEMSDEEFWEILAENGIY